MRENLPEQDVIGILKKGMNHPEARRAWDRFLGQDWNRLLAIANRFVKNTQDAEDVVARATEGVLRRIDTFEGQESNLRAYLATAVRNKALNHLRDSKLRRHASIDDEEVLGDHNIAVADTESVSPQEAVEAKQTADFFKRALALLTEDHRRVLELRIDGKEYVEIANILDVPLGTVMSRLSRARKVLPEAIDQVKKEDERQRQIRKLGHGNVQGDQSKQEADVDHSDVSADKPKPLSEVEEVFEVTEPPADESVPEPVTPVHEGLSWHALDEKDLLTYLDGDRKDVNVQEAWAEVVRRHGDRLRFMILSIVKNSEAVEDVLSTTLAKAATKFSSFHRDASLYTWLYRIARNTAIDHLRSEKKHRHDSLTTDEGEESDAYLEDTSGRRPDQLEDKQLLALTLAAIAELPEDQRRVLELILEGDSYKEIAEKFGIPEGTVMSRLFYARKKVKALVERMIQPSAVRQRSSRPLPDVLPTPVEDAPSVVDEPLEVSAPDVPEVSAARRKLLRLKGRVDDAHAQEVARGAEIEARLAAARDYLDLLLGGDEDGEEE